MFDCMWSYLGIKLHECMGQKAAFALIFQHAATLKLAEVD
jgi:hypothetical protein